MRAWEGKSEGSGSERAKVGEREEQTYIGGAVRGMA